MKTRPITYLIHFFICFFLSSCFKNNFDHYPQIIDQLYLAGDNSKELEKVLNHYSNPKDSLKYQAAVFLIKYMPGKYGRVYPEYNSYKTVFDTLENLNSAYEKSYKMNNAEFYKHYKRTVFNYFMTEHQIKNPNDLNFEIKEDIKTITADYLIENIDYAFKVWQMPWNKNLGLNDFCEFILPYRYGNEELQPWRKIYYENSIALIDSLKGVRDPIKAAMFLKQLGNVSISEISELKGLSNAIRPLDLIRINTTTSCKDETGAILLRLRGLGVPVARLSIPMWGNRAEGHDLNGVLTSDKKWFGFGGGRGTDAYKPPTIPTPYKLTKVFAELYGVNNKSDLVSLNNGTYETNLGYRDVTGYISTNVANYTAQFPNQKNGSKAFICAFNNSDWIPIASATIQNGKALFPQLGKQIIYMTAIYKSGRLELKNKPFLLDSNSESKIILPLKNKNEEIKLSRKYSPNLLLNGFIPTLEGCYFQGSNDSAFTNSKTLWKIDKIMSLRALKKNIGIAKYQFVRLVFPNIERQNEASGGIQIMGMQQNSPILLKGEPISSVKASKTFYEHFFDNNPLTFVQVINEKSADFKQFYDGQSLVIPDKQSFWIGLNLKRKTDITSLEFSLRTDDNDVNAGESYELFYWDNKWISLGKKTALVNHLNFNAPINALYLLKNLHKGKENRIFLYKNGRQVWY